MSKKPTEWQLVPKEPTEAMWGGVARAIVFWLRTPHPTGKSLHRHLEMTGHTIPDWLEKEIPPVDHIPPKGTVVTCIYKAMLDVAPSKEDD